VSRADALFEAYAESHRDPRNKAIHWVCVPLITWSVLALLWAASPWLAWAVVAAAMIFYVWMSPPIAVGMLAVATGMMTPLVVWQPGRREAFVTAAVVFVAAWIGQFIGHYIEGRRPSFLQDVRSFVVAPAWLLGSLYRRFGIEY
jgi:uncharacterized membrane protein YGL010W